MTVLVGTGIQAVKTDCVYRVVATVRVDGIQLPALEDAVEPAATGDDGLPAAGVVPTGAADEPAGVVPAGAGDVPAAGVTAAALLSAETLETVIVE